MTGQTSCAYCSIDLVSDYYRWLLLAIDHVVPSGEAKRLGIPADFYEDAINLVVTCSGCNGFLNRFRYDSDSSLTWTLEEFVALRDLIFDRRFELISVRRAREIEIFGSSPWANPVYRP